MTSCERYEIELSACLDGELSPEVAAAAIEHAFDCPSCATYFRGARALGAAARPAAGDEEAGEATSERLWKRIRERAALDRDEAGRAPSSVAVLSRLAPAAGWWRAAALVLLGLGGGWAFGWIAGPASAPLARAAGVRAAASLPMTDARFVTLADQLMNSDPRYQRAMLEVLRLVPALETGEGLGPPGERGGLVTIAERREAPRATFGAPR